jgi:hypothetical protein
MATRWLRAWVVLALSAITSAAAAERGTVQLTNGGQVTGELVEYVPGDHVTVDIGGGQQLVLKAADVAAVQVGSPPAAGLAAPAAAPAPAPAPAYDPHVQALLLRRNDLLRQRIGFGGPIAMLAGGSAMAIVGWGVIFPLARETCIDETFDGDGCSGWDEGDVAGAVIGSLGIALAITGGALIPSRVNRRRARTQELEQIDGELRTMGFTARVVPWLRTGGSGPSGGLTARLTF